MGKLLFLIFFVVMMICRISAFGSSTFYAEFILTNGAYGFGAQFPCKVWYDTGSANMRIDYFQPDGSSKFMTVYYNYATKDKYQICGSNSCSRATWNAGQPPFQWNTNGNLYTDSGSCITPDWPGPRACNTGSCRTFTATPAQPLGISSLSYNETAANNLCLVRWTPSTGFTYGPEWHITKYVTSAPYPNGSPTDVAGTYSSVLSGVTCPQPVCFAELDIALSIDESGSITQYPNGWNDVQNFVRSLIGSLDIKPNGVRVGLTYFSGIGDCRYNWTGTSYYYDANCGGSCTVCGARWNRLTTEVLSDKANLISLVNGHNGDGGSTCISCGIDQGIRILNAAPKANVQKLIILMTDGAQNMVTGRLGTMAKLAYDQSIKIIAVGVANYNINDLRQFSDTIYTTAKFNELVGLISQIITPLCQPLPSIETCNFCSGLCSCQANCNCPTCNDYNACTLENCDVRPAPQGTAGLCVSTPVTCDDNNPCTQNLCTPSTGCNYTVPTVKPNNLVDRFCKVYQCQNPQGFVLVDRGTSQCPPSTDLCAINYCDDTAGACAYINRNNTAFGVAITYTTSAGQTITTTGCGPRSNAKPCQKYSCNPTTGLCTEDNSGCACLSDVDCNDSNGCTTDVCDFANNRCVRTARDCWAELSGNSCISIGTQTNVLASTAVSDNFYANGPNVFPLNATNNNLPTFATRSCADLACYRGQRSTYSCQSLSSSTSQCTRSVINCQSVGCTDNVCQVTGGWTLGQVNTDCNYQKTYTCNDGVTCTRDDCVSAFTGVSCYSNNRCTTTNGANRCNPVAVNQNCNDNNVCTTDVCNVGAASGTSGCTNTPLPSQPSNLCYNRGCDPTNGNFSTVDASKCPADVNNKCLINYCDPTGAGSCKSIDRNTTFANVTVTYTDATGSTFSVSGCYKDPQNGCIFFKCDPTTGGCIVDSSSCGCTTVAQCDDNNGCTVDECKFVVSKLQCVNTPIDCFANFSANGCKLNQAFNPAGISNATGMNNYNNQNAQDQTLGAGPYTCQELGCFGGRRNTYTCVSLSSSQGECRRTPVECPKTGCTDTVCRTLGTWTGGQIDTDCGALIPIDCSGQANKCNIANCNPNSKYGDATRCTLTSNATLCNDNNVCTIDTCDDVNGCIHTARTDKPTENFCYTYSCDPNAGWVRVDRGAQQCVSDGCTIRYCDSNQNGGTGGCVSRNRTEFEIGTTATFTDSAGNTVSIPGCGRPANDLLLCRDYQCNVTSSQCYQNISTCECLTDTNCEDGTGCTIDKCVLATGKCSRQIIDCWSELSNGQCISTINDGNLIFPASIRRPVATNVAADTTIGLAQYYKNFTNLGINFNLDANGNPSPSTGVSRSCAQLACYNGNPSTYSCFSTNETSYTCQRVFSNCDRNGCQDNICRVLGTGWNSSQLSSDCGTIFRPNCADKDSCTNDFCNTAWVPTDPVEQRCLRTSLNDTGQCDDGNFCTFDYCDSNDTSSNPCRHNLYNDKYVRKNLCKNGTKCDTVQCTVNNCVYKAISCLPSNLCVFYKCNATTNGTCASFPTGLYKFDKCGVCGGNGLSCIVITPANPNKTSIAVALGVGLGVGLFFAAVIIAILSKKSFDMYNAIGMEQQGTVTNNPTHQGGEDHIDTSNYN